MAKKLKKIEKLIAKRQRQLSEAQEEKQKELWRKAAANPLTPFTVMRDVKPGDKVHRPDISNQISQCTDEIEKYSRWLHVICTAIGSRNYTKDEYDMVQDFEYEKENLVAQKNKLMEARDE